MKTKIFIVFLAITLAACAQTNTTDIQNTAVAIVQTGVALTQTALPTATPMPPTATPTATVVVILPTPLPTQPPFVPFMTPDAIQVKRWKEYQTELAKSLLPKEFSEQVLCEWVILGQSGRELYVVAVCLGGGRATAPAVIRLGTDGSIQHVEIVEYGSTRDFNIRRLFPPNIQEMIYSDSVHMISERLKEHLNLRLSYSEEPPLIILSANSTSTP